MNDKLMTFSVNVKPIKLSFNCKLNWKLLYSLNYSILKCIALIKMSL